MALEGGCRITAGTQAPIERLAGDFALIPVARGITACSLEPPAAGAESPPPVALGNGEFGTGAPRGPVDVRLLAGHCSFGSADASLLEVRLIEARRSTAGTSATPGLVRGLADARLATALRAMHERPMHAWAVAELAERVGYHAAGTFSAAFSRHVGRSPTHHTRDCAQAHARRDAA